MAKKNKKIYVGLAVGGAVLGVVLVAVMMRSGGSKYNLNVGSNKTPTLPTSNHTSSQNYMPTQDNVYPPPAGFTRDDVKAVQAYLGVTVDGWYGNETKNALNSRGLTFEEVLYSEAGVGDYFTGGSESNDDGFWSW